MTTADTNFQTLKVPGRSVKTGKRFMFLLLLFLMIGVLPWTVIRAVATPVQKGTISGTVIDADTGEPVIGANVVIDSTDLGAATNMDGVFVMSEVPVGIYRVTIYMIGYSDTKITGVKVVDGKNTQLNVSIKPQALAGDEVVVEARAVENTEALLMKNRQLANSVSDAISAEAIRKSGSSNAAEAMSQVTGVTVVDGKYLVVRGLGNRYSNTQINGIEVPSADPDKKSFQMDLIPSSLLDNIVTKKSFTPDEPGNFSGGMVNLNTKSYPDNLLIESSSGISLNSQTNLKDGYLTIPGLKLDWLGFSKLPTKLPLQFGNSSGGIPSIGEAFTNEEKARMLDFYSHQFQPSMAPAKQFAPINRKLNLSIGNRVEFLGRPLGFLGSFFANRKFTSYRDGTLGQWQLTGNVQNTNTLTNNFLLSDQRSAMESSAGGLATLNYKLGKRQKITADFIWTKNAESVARYEAGAFPRNLSGNSTFETRVLHYTERKLASLQLGGSHSFQRLAGISGGNSGFKLAWKAAYSRNRQDEPDLRYFSDNFFVRNRGGRLDTTYAIQPAIYPLPTRYFRNLDENTGDFKLDLSVPVRFWGKFFGNIKVGGAYTQKHRTFREHRFEVRQDQLSYDGNPFQFFSSQNYGIVDSSRNFFRFGNYIVDASEARGNYDGRQKIAAGYFMGELPLSRKLRIIAGARFETTRMTTVSQDSKLPNGSIRTNDWLPSINMVYKMIPTMNLRAAYGRTLARPSFREMVPYASFDFVGDYIFVGNTDLKRTLIDNYDLRWEWFFRPGQLIAVSGFYKKFDQPIERVIVNINGEVQFQNVPSATVSGIELEYRTQLDALAPFLRNFSVGGNVSFIHSNVFISAAELQINRSLDPDTPTHRALQGQSPYIVNANLSYHQPKTGTFVGLYFNVFGERLSTVGLGGTPNIFEQPRPSLNLNLTQTFWQSLELNIEATNLLDSSFREIHHFKGQDYVFKQHRFGRTFSFGIKYNIE